jgi:bisphosphoglycerate-independent phosphoglycerate mutase (AlkP superfamily)
MKAEALNEEKKRIEEKLRQLKSRMIQSVEQGRYFGLDRQIRQVQKNYQLMIRI